MALTIDIRLLSPTDDRSGFSCGEAALDRFFRHYAGQNQFKLGIAVTYVAVLDTRIQGFATVTVSSLEKRNLPKAALRRRLPAYPLPMLRLARLAVDRTTQGRGIGRQLLRQILLLAMRQRDAFGCIGVVVDAKPDSVGFYERLGFMRLSGVREGRLHGDSIPMFLDIDSIEAAVGR